MRLQNLLGPWLFLLAAICVFSLRKWQWGILQNIGFLAKCKTETQFQLSLPEFRELGLQIFQFCLVVLPANTLPQEPAGLGFIGEKILPLDILDDAEILLWRNGQLLDIRGFGLQLFLEVGLHLAQFWLWGREGFAILSVLTVFFDFWEFGLLLHEIHIRIVVHLLQCLLFLLNFIEPASGLGPQHSAHHRLALVAFPSVEARHICTEMGGRMVRLAH